MQPDIKRKNQQTLRLVLAVVAGMVLLSFASVPLYDLFCRVTGYGGRTMQADSNLSQVFDREITVRFNADTGRGMPWDFRPDQREVTVKVGADALVSFTAQNPTSRSVAGTSLYNVTPLKVGKYFHKTECFCFAEQVLNPGQETHFPVSFFIDPKMMDDPAMDDIKTITLSYTFFRKDSAELDKALESFYTMPSE